MWCQLPLKETTSNRCHFQSTGRIDFVTNQLVFQNRFHWWGHKLDLSHNSTIYEITDSTDFHICNWTKVAQKTDFAWEWIKWKNREHTFNVNSIMIERMFSKMQNCTSLGSVGFLRERQGNFCHKNLHLFSCFHTMYLSKEALPECKNTHRWTSSITSVICCPLTMILTCLSVSLYVGMQNRRRRANDGMVRNRVIC